jgi:uncharacterized membrane protein YidH (DUF202 family)
MGTAVRALVAVAGVATLLLGYAGKQQAVEAMRRTGVPRAPDGTRVETRAMRESALTLVGVALALAALGAVAYAREGDGVGLLMAAGGALAALVLVALLVHRRQRWRRPDDA